MSGRELINFGAQGTRGTHLVSQQGLIANKGGKTCFASGQQLRKPGRVSVTEIDVYVIDLVEVEHRIRPGIHVHLLRPAFKTRRGVEGGRAGIQVFRLEFGAAGFLSSGVLQCIRGFVHSVLVLG